MNLAEQRLYVALKAHAQMFLHEPFYTDVCTVDTKVDKFCLYITYRSIRMGAQVRHNTHVHIMSHNYYYAAYYQSTCTYIHY